MLTACGGARGCGGGSVSSGAIDANPQSTNRGGRDGAPALQCPELANASPWKESPGPFTLSDRGKIVSCAHAATYTASLVEAHPFFVRALAGEVHGFELFVIQYISETRPGIARPVSGLLYLPIGAGPNTPIAAVDHAASGMGPSCGPSRGRLITEAFGQQLAGMGYAVVAPDYAGMGVDTGMTSFLVGRAEAAATLDGLRALLSFREPRFDARTLGKELFLVGYSQGAHASLFAHQALDEHLGLHLLGSISYAPPMGDARAWLGDLAHADRPTDSASIFVAMSLYSHMLHSGAPEPSTWLSPDAAAKLPPLFHDECLATLPRPVASAFPFKRDFYRPAFLDAATRCTRSSDCSDFEPWHSEFAAEEPGDFQSTAPALILQGMADQVVPPETVACIRDRLRRRGTPVVACGYPGADHWTVVGASISDVVRWMNARRAGQQIDVCQTPLEVPCSAFH